MTCERYQGLRDDRADLLSHLPLCVDCRMQLEMETELERALGAEPPPPLPAGFEARLLERALATSALSRGSRAVLRGYAVALLATTAAVVWRPPAIDARFGSGILLGLFLVVALTVVPLLALAPFARALPRLLWRSITWRATGPGVLSCAIAVGALLHAGAQPAVAGAAQETAADQDAIAVATRVGTELADRVTGIAIAIGRDGAVVWERGFGLASVELAAPVRPETRFHVWSAAKAWTVTAAARLAEAGRLDPGASVSSIVPEFPDPGAILTPMQLATHRAGIRHYRDDQEAIDPGHCEDVSEAVAIFAGDPLVFAPGSDRSYSSWGYVLLSRVLERASGEPFERLLHREVLEPLGMTSVVRADPSAVIRWRAETYGRAADGSRRRVFLDATCKWGAGGYLSSAGDLARFYLGIAGGKLLSPPMAALVLGADADGSLRFGGSSEGGRSLVSGNVRDGLFVAIAANERSEDVDFVEAANLILRALAQREDGASR